MDNVNGQKCPTTGTWKGQCKKTSSHTETIHLDAGKIFPPCSHDQGETTWTLVSADKK